VSALDWDPTAARKMPRQVALTPNPPNHLIDERVAADGLGGLAGLGDTPTSKNIGSAGPEASHLPLSRRPPSFWIPNDYDPNAGGDRCSCCRRCVWLRSSPNPAMPGQSAWVCQVCHPAPPSDPRDRPGAA
jgi:hypothetical protein